MSVAVSLEACVRGAAAATAAASSVWADHCEAISIKHALQAQLLKPLLDPIYAKHGYPAALWCAFYSTVHPMGWENGDWYNTYMCPNERVCEPEALLAHPARWERQWQRCACTGREKLGDRDEAKGVPANVSLHGWHVPIFTLSCALCSHLHQRLGPAPFTAGHVPSPREPRTPERFKAMAKQYDESLGDFGFWHRWVGWNMYPFGAWFAGAVWPAQLDENSLEGLIAEMAGYRLTNGEVMQGFLWESLGLLAERHSGLSAVTFVYRLCGPVWRYDGPPGGEGVNRGVCAHAAGHGFYRFRTRVDLALPMCGDELLKEFGDGWRGWCEDGVYEAAFDALGVSQLERMRKVTWGVWTAKGTLSVVEEMCKISGRPADCAPNSGAEEAAGRLELVRGGFCSGFHSAAGADLSQLTAAPPPPSPAPLPPPPRIPPSPRPHRPPRHPPSPLLPSPCAAPPPTLPVVFPSRPPQPPPPSASPSPPSRQPPAAVPVIRVDRAEQPSRSAQPEAAHATPAGGGQGGAAETDGLDLAAHASATPLDGSTSLVATGMAEGVAEGVAAIRARGDAAPQWARPLSAAIEDAAPLRLTVSSCVRLASASASARERAACTGGLVLLLALLGVLGCCVLGFSCAVKADAVAVATVDDDLAHLSVERNRSKPNRYPKAKCNGSRVRAPRGRYSALERA